MTTIPDWLPRLEGFLAEQAGTAARVVQCRRLTGGASRDTWAVDVESAGSVQRLVLRRDMGGVISDDALSREQEFRVLQAARAAGVLVPAPRWLCADPGVLGVPFFLMDRLEGESVGSRVVRDLALAEARRALPGQMAEQVARIHAINPTGLDFVPAGARLVTRRTVLEGTARQLHNLGEPHPVLEIAIRWLLRDPPEWPEPVVVHGDFRVGNLMVGPAGLVGVFDWEFAHVGDPAEDLAWPCVRAWRFGQDRLRLGGVAAGDEFLDVYARLSGRRVSAETLRWWEILGNLRWAVGCVAQAQRHLSGVAPSLELASLGRRAAEMELELLDLLEEKCAMMDRPTSLELVQAVRLYLEKELQPALTDPRLRFQTLVAAHVLGIVERELPAAGELLEEEGRLLATILGHTVGSADVAPANEELCRRMRAGDYDEEAVMRAILGQLRPLVVQKLQIANPRYVRSAPT